VVDDDSTVRDAMLDLLQEDGRTVETYASSEAFLEAYRPGSEGCLLVDARMPGMGSRCCNGSRARVADWRPS
jgi:two-component system CheB/CheR fusion protein